MTSFASNTARLLQVAQVRLHDPATGKEVLARALLDPGSEINLVNKRVIEHLGLRVFQRRVPVRLRTVSGTSEAKRETSRFVLKHRNHESTNTPIEALVVEADDWYVRVPAPLPEWLVAAGDQLADPDFIRSQGEQIPFDMILDSAECVNLIGDCDYKVYKFAVKRSDFGLIPVGGIPSRKLNVGPPRHWCNATRTIPPPKVNPFFKAPPHYMADNAEVDDVQLSQDIARCHAMDMVDLFGRPEEEPEALKGFLDETVKSFQRRDGRVYVNLPKFHGMTQPLARNHAKVRLQLQSLENRMLRDPDLAQAYEKAIHEWIEMGVLIPTTMEEMNKFSHWAEMPYHPVFRKGVETHKVRFVMNGSADEPGKAALNRYLAVGPNILPQIVNILTAFRAHQYFSIADIEKAFLQVGLLEPDDHLFVFRWLVRASDGTYSQQLFRFAMMPWGINCAPFVLNAVVRFLYQEASDRARAKGDTDAVERYTKLSETTYVDDILALGNCVEDVIKMAHDAHAALEAGRMNVCKYRTCPPEMAQAIRADLDPVREVYKVLGLMYNPVGDAVAPAADNLGDYRKESRLTKKQAAGLVARLYDPLGLVAPVTLRSKLLLQLIEKTHPKASWSTKLTEEESLPWHEYVDDVLDNISTFEVPRCTRPAKYDKLRLCVFSDASANAVAGTLYEVAEVDGKMYPCLASSRNKVVPHKKRYTTEGVDTLTKDSLKINRLELTAALLAAQMAKQHMEATHTEFDEVVAFTDSQVTCHWLWAKSEHHTEYVRSRVKAIKDIVPALQWRHVPGTQNPADLASRGCTLAELRKSDLWFRGPEWMSQPRQAWPEIPSDAYEKLDDQTIDQAVHDALCAAVTTRAQARKRLLGNAAGPAADVPDPTSGSTSDVQADSGFSSLASSDTEDDLAQLLKPADGKPQPTKRRKVIPNALTWKQLVYRKLEDLRRHDSSHTPQQALAALLAEIQQDQLGNLYKHVQGTLPDRFLTDAQRNLKLQYGLRFCSATQLVLSRSRNFRIEEVKELRKPVRSEGRRQLGLAPVDKDLIFLTADDPRVKALVKELHESVTGHGSINHVAAESRKDYWILHVRKLAKDVRRHCDSCKLLDAKALEQVEGALPECRYDATKPETQVAFQAIGVDFVGPFFPYRSVYGGKKTSQAPAQDRQALIAVFSCAKTRAIHLEPVVDQSFEQFELAFRNFTARRGTPKVVFSDNAKTFKLAEKLAVFREDVSVKLRDKYAHSMQWVFNANRAPWWGGFFERMMRVIKEKLARNFYRHVFPSPDHFRAAVTSLEQFVNSRPLTTFYSTREESPPLTPEMFLRPGDTPSPFEFMQFALLPFKTQSMTATEARSRRQAQMNFQARLWYDFQHLYLDNLRLFHRTSSAKNQSQKIQPGMCVLITPDNTSFKPRAMLHKTLWRRGIVEKMYSGRDGHCRTVKIGMRDKSGKMFSTVYPIQKLCPLELAGTAKFEFLSQPNV